MSGNSMTVPRTTMVIAFAALAVLQPIAAEPAEVYRWVDANGVVNFSDRAPPASAATAGVRTLTLEDSQPAAYDPEQDLFNIRATLERTQALRESLAERREARRDGSAEQPAAAQYPEQSNTGYPWGYPYGYPPLRPGGKPPLRPPQRPPPQPEPPDNETATWRPPGDSAPQLRQ
jgi:hypothetical protein